VCRCIATPAPGGMRFDLTNSIPIARFDDSLLVLFARTADSRTPPQQRSLRGVLAPFVSAEHLHWNLQESRKLLDSTSTQASAAIEGGMMYTYTQNSAPASTPPALTPSRPSRYFWDAAPGVARYVMIALACLVFILCITIVAIILQYKYGSQHRHPTQYAVL